MLVAVGGFATYTYLNFTDGITHVNAIVKSTQPRKRIDGSAQNILLVGDDHRPAGASAQELAQLGTTQDGGSNNTDTMMILHIPANGTSSTLISLPRDSWVNIPGYGMNKLNAAFALGMLHGGPTGGARLLIQTVQNLTGLTIDHYGRISLLGFYDIATALGPIPVCLNHAVNDPYSGASFPAGVSTLNASQALAFVRQRHGLPLGDLDRVIRQQYFLSVEAHKFLSAGTLLNPVELHSVLSAVSKSIETDPGLNLLSLAAQLHNLTGGKIHSATIPVSGTPTIRVNGGYLSIVQVDTAAMPAFIQSVIGTPSAYTTANSAQPATVTVTVLNGGGVNGAAAQASGTLRTAGFRTGTPGNVSTTATTVIQYPTGEESQAKTVAEFLPKATVQQIASVTGITVLLGTDGIMPNSTPAPPGSAAALPPAPVAAAVTHNYSAKICID